MTLRDKDQNTTKKQKLVPLLFHRRLILLASVAIIVSIGLGVQLIHLTIIEGDDKRETAFSRLDQRTFLETVRGSILDRNGSELAYDRASYSVAVDYEVISGEWADKQATEAAKKTVGGRDVWNTLSPEAREKAIAAEIGYYEHQVENLWDILAARGDIDRAMLDKRLKDIHNRVMKMANAVWERQLQEQRRLYGSDEGFDKRPIREQTLAHTILQNVSQEMAADFRRMTADLPGLKVIDSRERHYPWEVATVNLRRDTLPLPLRNDEPISIEVLGVADQILGSMRDEVWASDIKKRPFIQPSRIARDECLEENDVGSDQDGTDCRADLGGYRPGDSVGVTGLEYGFEPSLRGRRGVVDAHLNTGGEDRIDPVLGRDLKLTLDISLQAKVQAILSPAFGLTRVQQFHAGWENDGTPKPYKLPLGYPLNSAAVVLDVDTGEILAMVSMPTIATGKTIPEANRALAKPHIDRSVAWPYEAGSIVKPLILAAAVTEGVHSLDTHIDCTGHYFPHAQTIARCWIYRPAYHMTTHTARFGGPLDARHAIGASCNIYFYTIADELGIDRLNAWYRKFGVGAPLDIGLLREFEGVVEKINEETGDVIEEKRLFVAGEHAGDLPSDDYIERLDDEGGLRFLTISMGIGQSMTWTPLQAANAYATLARGGFVRDAKLIMNDPREKKKSKRTNLGLSDRVVSEALEGLRASVTEQWGTGRAIRYPTELVGQPEEPILNAKNVTVWAKTGTAQAPPMQVLNEENEIVEIKGLDHAWFVGLVGSGEPESGIARPQYAIAVIVEFGGSGGRVAGPIANQIIHAMQDAGYLAGGSE